MITVTATDFARNLSNMLNRLEYENEEIAIMRNKHTIAKIVPGKPQMTALDVFADIYGILTDEEGKEWADDCKTMDHISTKELRDPWE